MPRRILKNTRHGLKNARQVEASLEEHKARQGLENSREGKV